MFLKTLTLKGFKSFADPTTIELEPGITVVVGPNGSGKSNVVDAVAWVLGAQGPKVVRSTKMDDVIFAGTSRRPALGRAEVSLTIDNASRRLPVDVAEVTITRTLFRTGESEYALNGAPCRLLDIQELLSDAGVGRQQHVIVSQGQLDSVLQARPEDRRMVIEEAAGVLKFRRRRERAERRLESSEQNLLRLQDLQREVRRQLRPLERQAEAARRHDGLVAELRSLRLHLAGREIDSLTRRRDSAEGSHASLTEQEAAQRVELARLDELVVSTESTLTELQAWDGADRLARASGARAFAVETRAGVIACERLDEWRYRVDMGAPRFAWSEIPLAKPVDDERRVALALPGLPDYGEASVVNMGNPHAVFWVADVAAVPLAVVGPRFETHPMFPEKANISFAQVVAPDAIRLRVWERGVGITLGCGSAACATLVAASRLGLANRTARIGLPGGALTIEWRASDDHVLMTGPVEFEREITLGRELFAPAPA